MPQSIQPTIETAEKFLIIALPVIFVLWLISKLLGHTIGEFFSGLSEEVRELAALNPTPRALNLIGGMAMIAMLVFFSRSIEFAVFSPKALNGDTPENELAMAIGSAFVIGSYFLLCIVANKDRSP